MRYSPPRTAAPMPPTVRISTPTVYRSAATSPSTPRTSPSTMIRATAPMSLLRITGAPLAESVIRVATCTRRLETVHIAVAVLRPRFEHAVDRGFRDGRSRAHSRGEPGAGPIADGVIAGVPHHSRVLRDHVRGRRHDRRVDPHQARRGRRPAAGAPLRR